MIWQNCMALHLNPCSSSSAATFLSSSKDYYNDAYISSKLIILPSKTFSSSWVSRISSRLHSRHHFLLKSSNGHPPDAAFQQDGLAGNPSPKDHIEPLVIENTLHSSESDKTDVTLSITVVGASGDLAKKKIFPALFALFYEDCLPENFTVFGYARTKMNDEELRNMISRTLTCRVDKRENCDDKMDQFLKRCFYHAGLYNSEEDFQELDKKLKEREAITLLSPLSRSVLEHKLFFSFI